MILLSFALCIGVNNTAAVPRNTDLAPGVALVRFFNTLERSERTSGAYKTAQELQGSRVLSDMASQSTSQDLIKAMNQKDLSTPLAGWSLRLYTSPDRQHYLIRVENSTGLAVISDEGGLIQIASPSQ